MFMGKEIGFFSPFVLVGFPALSPYPRCKQLKLLYSCLRSQVSKILNTYETQVSDLKVTGRKRQGWGQNSFILLAPDEPKCVPSLVRIFCKACWAALWDSGDCWCPESTYDPERRHPDRRQGPCSLESLTLHHALTSWLCFPCLCLYSIWFFFFFF